MRHIKKFMALSSVLGASVLYVGCGAAGQQGGGTVAPIPQPGVAAPISTACPANSFNTGWGCVYASDFQSACTYGYGQLTTSSGVQVCRTIFNSRINFTARGLPLLAPGDVTGYNAFNTGLPLRAGDKMEFYGTGGWGSSSVSVKRRLGGLFTRYTTNYDCDEINLNGVSDEGAQATNNGEPAALYGTDGTQRFLVGASLTKQIANNGTLRLGFNAPYVQNGCSTLNISSLKITRCIDSSGNTYPCQ